MQHTKVLKNKDNDQDPLFIFFDARQRNEEGIKLYSEAEIVAARALQGHVGNVFTRSRVFINYREKFVSIKVDNPSRADLVSLAAADLEAYCKQHNVEIVKSSRGLLFRIPKA
jgi:hypothetical protein